MSIELLIHGGAALDGSPLEVAIDGYSIAAVGAQLELDARERIDATGLTILAGTVDPHVPFNAPGFRSEWEGWATGSAAAAAGGVTTVIEMPLNAHPPTIDAGSFDLKAAVASERSQVDFALWGGVVPGNLAAIGPLAERGVIGFKAFMSASGVDDFGAVDDLTLLQAMREIAPLGLPVALHAESEVITSGLAARARAEGSVSMRDYLDSRPAIAETQAIVRAIELAADAGCRLHVVHTSTARGVRLVAEARAAGVDVTCEVTPHNLILTEDDAIALGALAKCAPPLRSRAETERLWSLVAAGEVAFTGSDHSPSSPELKRGDDAFATWGGISGVQTLLEVMLTEGRTRVGAELLTVLLGGGAAKRFGLERKGCLAVGADADVALVELGPMRELDAAELRYRHPYSAWVGRKLTARVRRTVLRGRTVYLDGELTGGVGGGKLVTPTASG